MHGFIMNFTHSKYPHIPATGRFSFASVIIAFFLALPAISQQELPELGIYEQLDNSLPEGLVFIDEDYNKVNLTEAIDKPTVIALVYYDCPGICSPLLEGVAQVINVAKLELGKDYQVFTISFDPSETSRLAKDKKKNFTTIVKNQEINDGWRFFTGDSANVNKLLNSVGYKVKREGEEFVHPAALIVLSPEAKITRYLYGIYFLPFDLKMAVIEANEGRSGPTINKVLRYCFSYDPEGKKYVINITKVSGTLILVMAVSILAGLLISERRKRSKKRKLKEK